MGTPEAGARALANLSRGDGEDQSQAKYAKGLGANARHASINVAGGVKWLVHMLDGSNLSKGKTRLKPPTAGGWPSLRVGIAGCHETEEIFPGSQVDFGLKIGMQEQAAATVAEMACITWPRS